MNIDNLNAHCGPGILFQGPRLSEGRLYMNFGSINLHRWVCSSVSRDLACQATARLQSFQRRLRGFRGRRARLRASARRGRFLKYTENLAEEGCSVSALPVWRESAPDAPGFRAWSTHGISARGPTRLLTAVTD